MFVKFPPLSEMSVEQLDATGALLIAAGAFIISIVAMIVGAITIYAGLKQYSLVKRSENEIKQVELEKNRFKNAQYLFKMLSTHENGAFAEIAAAEFLTRFTEYFRTYEYLLSQHRSFTSTLKTEADLRFNKAMIAACERLVEQTRSKNH